MSGCKIVLILLPGSANPVSPWLTAVGVRLLTKKAGEPLWLDDANTVLLERGPHVHKEFGVRALGLITVHSPLPKEKEEFLDSDTVVNQLPTGPFPAVGSRHPREQRFAAHVNHLERTRGGVTWAGS